MIHTGGESPLSGLIFVLLCLSLVHCGICLLGVERRTWPLSSTWRSYEAPVSRFAHTTPGVSASVCGEDSADPRDIVLGRERSRIQQSILHLSEPLSQCVPHSSCSLCLEHQLWLVFQTMSGSREGRPTYSLPPPNYRWAISPHWLGFISLDCCIREAVQRVWHG